MASILLVEVARAQSSVPSATRNDQWQRLSQRALLGVGAPPTGAVASLNFKSRADELRDFRSLNPSDSRNGEARRLEALMLLYADLYGDKADTARCNDLVNQVRTDVTLSAQSRYRIAAEADCRDVLATAYAHDDERLEALEKILRSLASEFPNVPQAYEALLHLADSCRSKQAVRIAGDLLRMAAPSEVKVGAQQVLDRHALVGASLGTIFSDELGASKAPSLNQTDLVVLYAWASWNEGSLDAGRLIAALAPRNATVIGINLDTDLTKAVAVAKERALPGIHLYDNKGLASRLAVRLRLNGKDDIYLANRQGRILTVTARLNLKEEISAHGN